MYDLVLLFIVVNNLTHIHMHNIINRDWTVSPRWTEEGNLVDYLTDLYTTLRDTTTAFTEHVLLCPVIGIDMAMYNGTACQYLEQQKIINAGVVHLNKVLCSMNSEAQYVAPWLSNTVHHIHHGR